MANKTTNAKLKVQFFWPFSGPYWIIDLDADYQYAGVGHPKRKFLWILCRTRDMAAEQYDAIIEKVKSPRV